MEEEIVDIYEFDGKEYALINKISDEYETYFYFTTLDENDNDLLIRKVDKEDSQFLIELDSVEELKHALELFSN